MFSDRWLLHAILEKLPSSKKWYKAGCTELIIEIPKQEKVVAFMFNSSHGDLVDVEVRELPAEEPEKELVDNGIQSLPHVRM